MFWRVGLAGAFAAALALAAAGGMSITEAAASLGDAKSTESLILEARSTLVHEGLKFLKSEAFPPLLKETSPACIHTLLICNQCLENARNKPEEFKEVKEAIAEHNATLAGLSKSAKFPISYLSTKLLGEVGDEAALKTLSGTLIQLTQKAAEPRLAARIIQSIVQLSGTLGIEKAKDCIPGFVACAKAEDASLAAAACEALGTLGDEKAKEPLLLAVSRPEDVVFANAQEAVIKLYKRYKRKTDTLIPGYTEEDRKAFVDEARRVWP